MSSATILDGKRVASDIERDIMETISESGLRPKLLIVTDNHDPSSRVYVRNKVKAAERCGIDAEVYDISKETKQELVRREIINSDADAIIIQLPIQAGFESGMDLINCIPAHKDVDGLSIFNTGCLHLSLDGGSVPCTPQGIMTLLKAYQIDIDGKHAVVVGRSKLVGRPIAELLLQNNATVTICHSHTRNLREVTRQADILITAVGKPRFITEDMIKPGAVVVDVGINRGENGKLCGDVDFDKVKNVAGWITPTPGGVGPMTVATLLKSVTEKALC